MSLGGNARSIDLGCGPNKVENCFGVDSYQFEEVDLVCDLNKFPWPIEDDSFEVVYARQIIEHVDDAVGFLKEIHRIAKNDAEVHIETPHFSAASSWGDITHLRHLAAKWHASFTRPKHYLFYKLPKFELIENSIRFSHPNKFRNLVTRSIIKIFGLHNWERKWSFIFRGENIYTILKVVKDNKADE